MCPLNSKSETQTAVTHLTRAIGLCQTPRDSWTPEDTLAFRAAQEFVQKNREGNNESKREETSTGTSNSSSLAGKEEAPTEEAV